MVYLRPGVRIIRLPEDLADETFIGGGCGLPTAFHAVERADILMGQTVVVQGAGPVGLSCIALARLRGADCVIAIGAPSKRLAAAERMGADVVLDVEATGVADRAIVVAEATAGRGADVVIEASGNPEAVCEGLDLARDAGTYVIVGQYTDHGDVAINPHLQINKKHLDIRGVWGIDFSHLYRSILMQQRYNEQVHWEQLITHRFDLDGANDALAVVGSGDAIKAVICPQGL